MDIGAAARLENAACAIAVTRLGAQSAMPTYEGAECEVGPQDTIYISPFEHHHLKTIGDEPLGFLCMIPNKEMLKKLSDCA